MGSYIIPSIVVPIVSTLVMIGVFIATVKIHGIRITKLEDKEYCASHHDLCQILQRQMQELREDTQYLRQRVDLLTNHLGK